MAIQGVKVNRQTRAVIARGQYPNAAGDPIPDFDIAGEGPDEWLIEDEPVSAANVVYDPRYYYLHTTEAAAPGDEHPSYPGVGRFLITYSTPKLDIPSIVNNLENAENDANNQAWPTQKQFKIMAIAIRAVYKLSQGLNLTAIEQAAFNIGNDYTVKILDNYANAQAKKTLIEAGQEPDLDEGWEI